VVCSQWLIICAVQLLDHASFDRISNLICLPSVDTLAAEFVTSLLLLY